MSIQSDCHAYTDISLSEAWNKLYHLGLNLPKMQAYIRVESRCRDSLRFGYSWRSEHKIKKSIRFEATSKGKRANSKPLNLSQDWGSHSICVNVCQKVDSLNIGIYNWHISLVKQTTQDGDLNTEIGRRCINGQKVVRKPTSWRTKWPEVTE